MEPGCLDDEPNTGGEGSRPVFCLAEHLGLGGDSFEDKPWLCA